MYYESFWCIRDYTFQVPEFFAYRFISNICKYLFQLALDRPYREDEARRIKINMNSNRISNYEVYTLRAIYLTT